MLKVTGDENKSIYSGKQTDEVYHPEGGTIQNMPTDENAVKLPKPTTLPERIEDGKSIYNKTCFACHQPTGEGLPNTFPPLAKSDYLNADANRAIEFILKGKTGEIVVNGKKYNSVMTAQVLTDDEIANVLTFVYSSWGNSKKDITPAMVAAVRKTIK
jgi:nitrite reductase (NO-forming)